MTSDQRGGQARLLLALIEAGSRLRRSGSSGRNYDASVLAADRGAVASVVTDGCEIVPGCVELAQLNTGRGGDWKDESSGRAFRIVLCHRRARIWIGGHPMHENLIAER